MSVGYLLLLTAFMVTAYTIWAGASSLKLKDNKLLKKAQLAVYGQFILISLSVALLWYAFITHDFSFRYVAEYSDRKLPLFYAISALWAGQAGSLLLWTWLLTIFNAFFISFNKHRGDDFKPYIITINSLVTSFFMGLVIFSTNPFEKLNHFLPDGYGLNPLLQNPEMVFHPPSLFLGFVGFTIPFAYALTALMKGDLSSKWLNECRNWTLVAWIFLTIGNLLGAQWAYVELGWGGYWAWDPVENASLLPWLTGTAFVHSIMAQRSRHMMKWWNVSLAVTTFLLTILGTFITRSGIISSVHSFGKSNIGTLFLAFMGIVILIAISLMIWRRQQLAAKEKIDHFLNREFSFLLINVIFIVLTITILWGTLYPALTELFIGQKITLGENFFNKISIPFGILMFLLLAICPLLSWRETKKDVFFGRGLFSLIAAIIFGTILFFAGIRHLTPLMVLSIAFLAVTILISDLIQTILAYKNKNEMNFFSAVRKVLNRQLRRYAAYLIHIGVVMIFLSIVGTTAYKQEKEITLKKGEATTLGNYRIIYVDLNERRDDKKDIVFAELAVYRGEVLITKLFPQSHYYKSAMRETQRTSEIDMRSNLKEDLYVSLASYQEDGSATLVLLLNPLMNWMWIGGLVITSGVIIILIHSTNKKKQEQAASVDKKEKKFSPEKRN